MATSRSQTRPRELSKKRETESELAEGEGDHPDLPHDGRAAGSTTEETPLLAGSNPSQSNHGGGSPHDGGRRDDNRHHHPALRPNKKLDQFCERLDIGKARGYLWSFLITPGLQPDLTYAQLSPVPPPEASTKYAGFKPKTGGDWARILSSVRKHRVLSYGLKALAVVLVILQLGLGITVSVLTGIQGNQARTVVIILGAVNSFVGGLAAILQYWGQPTRESRYYASLKLVQSDVEALIGEFKDPNTDKDPYVEGKMVMAKYAQANKDAWSNDPMIWIQDTKPGGRDGG